MNKKLFKIILNLIIFSLLGLIIMRLDIDSLKDIFKIIKPYQIILLLTLQLFTVFLLSLQWYKIGKLLKFNVGYLDMTKIYIYGVFIESITPSVKAGGELVKLTKLNKDLNIEKSRALSLISIQKSISFFAFFILTLFSAISFLNRFNTKGLYTNIIQSSLLILFLIISIFFILIFFSYFREKLINLIPEKTRKKYKIDLGLIKFKESIEIFFENKRIFILHILLGFFIWSFFPFKTYLIAMFLGIELSFVDALIVTYLTYLIGMVPISPGGLGTFELSMVFFLSAFNVAKDPALFLAIILRFTTFWFVLLTSFLIYLIIKIKEKINKKISKKY